MPKTVPTTRTQNPLHFEDLEPHRFEDLIRRLLYGFREWTEIEPTGRAGADEGYDIRAWEKTDSIGNINDEGEEGLRSSQGNLWQVQVKREKTITPAKIRTIINSDVAGNTPPYGYILAAATNISKTAYDTFREELRKGGVKETYFWGKDYLEDQLAQPANDDILFTFFGTSLSIKRRARASEIKFTLNNKNKLIKLFFGSDAAFGHEGAIGRGRAVLLRDIKDQHYPFSDEYEDFNSRRRWEEHDAVQLTSRGVYFKCREWYAYLDKDKKEWDYTEVVDLTLRKHNLDERNQRRLQDEGKWAEYYWRHTPLRCQAKIVMYGFVPFEDMLIIDDKGDPEYSDPHIFVDFGSHGPFSFVTRSLRQPYSDAIGGRDLITNYKQIDYFPKTFKIPQIGKKYNPADLNIDGEALLTLQRLRGQGRLYGVGAAFGSLREGDLILIPDQQELGNDSKYYAEVTHVEKMTVSQFRQKYGDWEANRLKELVGREVGPKEDMTIYELARVFDGKNYHSYSDTEF